VCADYAEVITEIRSSVPGAAHSPVIGFGGSYGGMLATWMRFKVGLRLPGAKLIPEGSTDQGGVGCCAVFDSKPASGTCVLQCEVESQVLA
jgi:hypothetical protein